MENMEHRTNNPFTIFPLQGGCLCERGQGVVYHASFLTGMALAVVLGLMFTLSTPAFAFGGGGGGSAPASAPAPKITKVVDPVAGSEDKVAEVRKPVVYPEDETPVVGELKAKEPKEETLAIEYPDEDKAVNKPDERTTDFPEDKTVEVIEATVGFAASASSVREGNDARWGYVQVELSKPLPQTVTLDVVLRGYTPSGSTASIYDDLHSWSDNVTFRPGETSGVVSFIVADDSVVENNESFLIGLRLRKTDESLPHVRVTLLSRTHVVTIIDNDVEVEEAPEGHINKEIWDSKDFVLENVENVESIFIRRRHGGGISIKNATQGIVQQSMGATADDSFISHVDTDIENRGIVKGSMFANHNSNNGNISIVNHGRVGDEISATHRGAGDTSIINHGEVNYISARHYRGQTGDIIIENRGNINRSISVIHYGNGIIRFSGDEASEGVSFAGNVRLGTVNFWNLRGGGLSIENRNFGNYEGTKETQLNFHAGLREGFADLYIEGEAAGQSRVSLVGELIEDPSLINENMHFPYLIEVEGQAQPDTFVGEQVVGPYKYVLEYQLDELNAYEYKGARFVNHYWHFNNKGLSEAAKKSAKIPDDIEKDMGNPPKPKVGPDGKPELGLWGDLDSSRTDIGLGFPAFVSNDDYHVGSQVQYYLQDDRSGIRALVETEYNFDVMNFRITPQARLTWTRVGFEDFVGPHRERISLVDGDTVDLRLGVSFDNEYRFSNGLGYLYGGLSIQAPIDGKTSVKVSGVNVVSERNDVSVDGKLGLSYEWDEGYAVYGEASALHRDDADEVRANLGVRIDF